jgi:hypothetical protein
LNNPAIPQSDLIDRPSKSSALFCLPHRRSKEEGSTIYPAERVSGRVSRR